MAGKSQSAIQVGTGSSEVEPEPIERLERVRKEDFGPMGPVYPDTKRSVL